MTWVGDCPDCFSYRDEITQLEGDLRYQKLLESENEEYYKEEIANLERDIENLLATNKKLHRRIELMRKEGNDEL